MSPGHEKTYWECGAFYCECGLPASQCKDAEGNEPDLYDPNHPEEWA